MEVIKLKCKEIWVKYKYGKIDNQNMTADGWYLVGSTFLYNIWIKKDGEIK